MITNPDRARNPSRRCRPPGRTMYWMRRSLQWSWRSVHPERGERRDEAYGRHGDGIKNQHEETWSPWSNIELVYWWTADIANARGECLRARRLQKRARGRQILKLKRQKYARNRWIFKRLLKSKEKIFPGTTLLSPAGPLGFKPGTWHLCSSALGRRYQQLMQSPQWRSMSRK